MPVTIRQKQSKVISTVTYHDYYHNINKNLYEVLSITGLYELYNSISGEELWQTTLEEAEANEALFKHPNIFRLSYSDKNTDYEKVIQKLIDELPKETKYQSFFWRLLNSKLVLYTKKNAKPAFIKIWKLIVAVFIFLLGCYLSSGNHFDNLIKWVMSFF